VITHAHNDRLGGIGALGRRGVVAVALQRTAEIARTGGGVAPDSVRGLGVAPRTDAAGFELYYPGHGHSPDNIVVYFPRQRALFGGCLVKPDSATTTGNVADADVEEWPLAVARVRERYAAARIVVPGHGAVSGASALTATERLIAEKGPAAVEALRRR
jgi:metallo-beta-lactamase class B